MSDLNHHEMVKMLLEPETFSMTIAQSCVSCKVVARLAIDCILKEMAAKHINQIPRQQMVNIIMLCWESIEEIDDCYSITSKVERIVKEELEGKKY